MPLKSEPITLEHRRQWATEALAAHNRLQEGGVGRTVTGMDEDIIDLVADLLHLADREGIDVDRLLGCARMHWDAERKDKVG
nr:hypothetical protein [Nitrospirota bacterium]